MEHAVIVGSSSGGALAIDFAVAHPEMVDGLFLIGPVLHGMEYSAEFRERANRNNEPMERDDVRAMARNWSQDKFLIAGTNEKARRKIYEQLVANAEKLKKYDAGLEEKLAPPASERLAEIKAPTWILIGQGDTADVQVAPPNVVILFTDYVVDAGLPIAQLSGQGTAWVFTAGQLVEGCEHPRDVERLVIGGGACGPQAESTRGQAQT